MSTMTTDETYNEASEPRSGGHMKDESFNGYANRETWAFNLHWSNDQAMYGSALEVAQDYIDGQMMDDPEREITDYELGESVVEHFRRAILESAYSPENNTPLGMMRNEVGSWWRVDRREVGEAVREALEAEGY